jgi:hypothetical protein
VVRKGGKHAVVPLALERTNPVCVKRRDVSALNHAGGSGVGFVLGPGVAVSEVPVFRV